MLNYKSVMSKIERLNPVSRYVQVLPSDFGSMYLLYPSENECMTAAGQRGMLDKVMDSIRLRWKRAGEVRYYKQNSLY